MEDIKKQIIAWFNSPQDYGQGMDLLQRISRKNRVIGKLIKRGETRASFEKLVYELNKVAGLKRIPEPKAKLEAKLIRKPLPPLKHDVPDGHSQQPEKKQEKKTNLTMNLAGKMKGDYSPEMQRVVKENSTLCLMRGKKHKALVNLTDDNSKETQDERVKLMNEIEAMTNRIEVLYKAWVAYNERKTEPDPDELWPEEGKKENENAGNQDAGNKDLSVDDLKNEKKNLQSSITKDRNLILYSGKTKPKDGKENPMPAGPKRTKVEKRIAKKEAEIKELDQRIADLS